MGKGNAGDTEATELRGKCKEASKKTEKGDLVLKNEHHLLQLKASTAVSFRIPSGKTVAEEQLCGDLSLAATSRLWPGPLFLCFPIKSPP